MASLSALDWLVIVVPVLLVGAVIGAMLARRGGRHDLIAPVGAMAPARESRQPTQAPVSLPQDVELKVWVELRHGNVINAIKLVRDATGIGLKEAKEHVDALRSSDPQLR